jgi:Ricin-type beta-trefoil lectin domain
MQTDLVNGDFPFCLDAHLPTVDVNGGRVQVWQCNEQDNQEWWQWTEGLTTLQLPGVRHHDRKARCLDAVEVSPNVFHVRLWECNGFKNQGWKRNSLAQGQWVWESERYPGRCLQPAAPRNGADVNLVGCHSGDSQWWWAYHF